jgi:hypothetical protein
MRCFGSNSRRLSLKPRRLHDLLRPDNASTDETQTAGGLYARSCVCAMGKRLPDKPGGIQLAFTAFCEGCEKAQQQTSSASSLSFDQQLEAAIAARIPLEEQLLMRVSSRARANALAAARKHHLQSARLALDQSDRILASPHLQPESRLLVHTFHAAVLAYYEYKAGRIDRARSQIFQALAIDETLITQYNYTILELHRVQLGHNLMRIHIRCNEFLTATQLCVLLLTYLEGDRPSWPLSAQTTGADPALIPKPLCAAMFAQITGELALLLAARPRQECQSLFRPFKAHAEFNATTHCRHHQRAHEWFSTKWALLQGEDETYLEQAAALLRAGPGEIPLLWQTAAADLYRYCCDQTSDAASELAAVIARFARQDSRQLQSLLEPSVHSTPPQ